MLINEIKIKHGYRYVLIDENIGDILCSFYIINIKNQTAYLKALKTPEKFRNKGYAHTLLTFVMELYSDYTISLNACPYGNHINKNNMEDFRIKLKKLYSKVGFVSKPGTKSAMIRRVSEKKLF